jgi:hypothetical protein
LWEEVSRAIGNVQLSGIYANKSGYHNTRWANWSGDYSVTKTADKKGPGDKASALDITFPEAHQGNYSRINLYTKRLFEAIRARDSRLWINGVPVLREVIGNIDGRARGLDCYTFVETARDNSHLWHIHKSLTRQFAASWTALAGIVSILTGEDDMPTAKEVVDELLKRRIAPNQWPIDRWNMREDGYTVASYLLGGYTTGRAAMEDTAEALAGQATMRGEIAGLTEMVRQLASAPPADLTPEQFQELLDAVSTAAAVPGNELLARMAAAGDALDGQ